MTVELFGDPAPDLQGKEIYFETSPNLHMGIEERSAEDLVVNPRQIGVVGDMTANRHVRTFEGSIENFYRRSKLGEPPPMQWKRLLHLEWSGPNGNVVVSLVDPEISTVDGYEGTEAILSDFPPPDPPTYDPNFPPQDVAPSITEVRYDPETKESSVEDVTPEDDEDDDPFNLFPKDLHQQLAEENRRRTAAWKQIEAEDPLADTVLMDEFAAGSRQGTSMGEIIGKVPHWESLSEEKAEELLRLLIMRLAMYNVAYDVCEHVTMKEAYRILVDELAKDATVEPELMGTGWISHFCTHEFCPACEAEILESMGDDDVPF